jgi:hypothetical protein
MTITVECGNQKNRWGEGLVFNIDSQDIRSITWDYTGEIGSDTVSTATATAVDITAGTPVVTANTVSIPMSAGNEGSTATLDLLIVTAAGDQISRKVSFIVGDY